MSEAHWVGESSIYGDNDIIWCVTCDKKINEILGCGLCNKDCCEGCSIVGKIDIICIDCIESGEKE